MNLIINIFSIIYLLAHPIHLTVTNVEYNDSDKYIEISIRLFVDDFETILSHKNNQKINLGKNNENIKTDDFITKYITDNLIFDINYNQINSKKFVLKERKIEDITIWLIFRVKFKGKINKVEITNTLMTDLYRDQKNMLIFTYNNKQSALEFSRKETIRTLSY